MYVALRHCRHPKCGECSLGGWGVNYLYGESVLYMMKLGEPLRIMDFKTI